VYLASHLGLLLCAVSPGIFPPTIDESDGVTMLNKTAKMLLGISLLSAGSAMADVTTMCTKGKAERSVAVTYAADGKAPCEVKYTTAGNTKTLWSAKKQANYCETKANEFTEKLKSQGWNCAGNAAAQPAAEQPATAPAAQ
jgi:hypothetical protein